MASYYVYSGAGGAATGADWANAYLTMTLALVGKVAGDIFYVAHDHAESTAAAVTLTFQGTEVSPSRIYCVNRLGSVPPVPADQRTTGSIATTGAFTITLGGTFKFRGIIFSAGSGASIASIAAGTTVSRSSRFAACQFILANTATTSRITLGGLGGLCLIENCTFTFGNVSQGIIPTGRLFWRNNATSAILGTIPTSLLIPGANVTRTLIAGVDLSAVGAAKNLVTVAAVTTCSNIIFKDCKLGVGVNVYTGAFNAMGALEITLIRCDSIDTNYRTEHHFYLGAQTTDPTVYRNGGASDGTTPISWKIVTSANSEWGWPFETIPISFWNEVVGYPINVTVQGIWAGGAVPLNDEIWIDVPYLGVSGFPLGLTATCTKAGELDAGANLPAGSGQWVGMSGTQFAMTVSFTPQEKGPVTVYVNVAKVSSTFYIDPKPVVV